MKSFKKIIFSLFIPLALVLMALGLSCSAFAEQDAVVDARGPIYVGSGATCTITGGTVNGDIDVDGGSLYLTGGTVKGNINLNGTFNYKSSCTLDGKVNLLNTSSYVTLSSSLTQTMTVVPSSMNKGTKIAYSATSSYLDVSKFNVEGLPALKRLVVSNGYIQIDDIETYTVTISSTTGGSVDVKSVPNVQKGTKVTVNSNKLTIEGYATITATATTGYSFTGWTNTPSTITSAVTITANFQINTYTVTISAGSGGLVNKSSITAEYGARISSSGRTLTIGNESVTATANAGYTFSSWSKTSGTITSETTIYAYFEQLKYTVSIYAGTGGSVDRSAVYDVPYNASYSTSGSTLTVNGTRIQATASSHYSFDYWSCSSSGRVTDDMTIYAYFTADTYTIYFSAGTGGSVSRSSMTASYGARISSSGRTLYIGSTSVTATANSGYTFDYWSTTSGTITGSTTFYAYFTANTYTVYFSAGSGGRVDKSAILDVPYGSEIEVSGNKVRIVGSATVTATANSGYAFDYWGNTTGTITSSRTITAYFKEAVQNCTVTIKAGSGGSVDTSSLTVPKGTTYSTYYRTLGIGSNSIEATPNSGYFFTGWDCYSEGTIDSDMTITAKFFYANNAEFVVGVDVGRTVSLYEKELVLAFRDLKDYQGDFERITASDFGTYYQQAMSAEFYEFAALEKGISFVEVSFDDYMDYYCDYGTVDLFLPSATSYVGTHYGYDEYYPQEEIIGMYNYYGYPYLGPAAHDYHELYEHSDYENLLITEDMYTYIILTNNRAWEDGGDVYVFDYPGGVDVGNYRIQPDVQIQQIQEIYNNWGGGISHNFIAYTSDNPNDFLEGFYSGFLGSDVIIMLPTYVLGAVDGNLLDNCLNAFTYYFFGEAEGTDYAPLGHVNLMHVNQAFYENYLSSNDLGIILDYFHYEFSSYAYRKISDYLESGDISFVSTFKKLDLLRNIIGY